MDAQGIAAPVPTSLPGFQAAAKPGTAARQWRRHRRNPATPPSLKRFDHDPLVRRQEEVDMLANHRRGWRLNALPEE
jgi:hypothetical protein